MTWDLSCPDWRDRLREGRSLVPDLPLNLVEGDRAVRAFNRLRLHDVPGTPTLEEAGGDWFRDIVRALFGSLDPVTRQRMIRELFLLVPKKNSKTTNGALLMLVALLMNVRPDATFILTAPVQDVAEKAYEAAAGAIELDVVLQKLFHVRDHKKTILHRQTKATLEIMTFDPSVLTGQKVSGGALIDELHVVAGMNKADRAVRQLRGGMLPFPEAFLAFITTQSEDAPSGVFDAELTKARAIRDGKQPGAMLPVLYEFPKEMQVDQAKPWKDSKNWRMVTPNAGRSISIDRLVEEMATAEATSEKELRAWASQHLNVQIGMALGSNSWAGAEHWQANAEKVLSLENLLQRSEVVTAGVDGGGLDDLLGFGALGRETVSGNWLHWGHAWAHEIVLRRRKDIEQLLRDFEKDGDLTIIPDDSDQDITDVADRVEQIEAAGLLDRVGVDPAGIGAIVDAIEDKKIEHDRIVGISQGWRMVGSIKTVERKVAARGLRHGGTRLMAWCCGNAKVIPAGNAVLITKQVSGTAKIDPLMALFNAAALMSMNPKPRKKQFQFFAIG